VCAAPHGGGGPRDPTSLGSPGTPRRCRQRWPPARSRWGEVVELHPVVVAQPAHEAARRRGEPVLVMPNEANDVVIRRVGLPICRRRNDPRQRRPCHVRRQLTAVHKLVQGEHRHRPVAPRQWIQHCD
jgi:hypothetical protein